MNHWAEQYIGLPWESGAQGPEAFDCWAFLRHVQQHHFGRHLPVVQVDELTLGGLRVLLSDGLLKGWERTESPREGDGVLMPRANEIHVGLWVDIDGGRILHCAEGFGVVAQPVRAIVNDGWTRFEYWRAC